MRGWIFLRQACGFSKNSLGVMVVVVVVCENVDSYSYVLPYFYMSTTLK